MTDVIGKTLRLYRTSPARGAKPKVDRNGGDLGQGIIRGAAIVTRGEALGHGEWIDGQFVAKVGERIKSAKRGVKMRFTHPSLSGDGLGTFLGRAKNSVTDSDKSVADIHFSKASHNTPDGDLAAYVMDLAEEDPEAFGVSIAYEPDWDAEDRFAADHKDEDGNFHSPDKDNANNYPHARLSRLRAADVVDDPAANPDGLFRRGHEIAEEADALCEFALGLSDKKPELQLLSADAERVAGFAARFLSTHNLEIKEKSMPEDTKLSDQAVLGLIADVNALSADLAALKAQLNKPGELLTAVIAERTDPGADERKRCREIYALAQTSGLDDWSKIADEAVDGCVTVEQFRAALSMRRIATNGLTRDSGEQSSDPEAKYKKEYAAQRAAYVSMGHSEQDYILARRIEDGFEVLAYVPKDDKEAA